jgi:hypothetical protein
MARRSKKAVDTLAGIISDRIRGLKLTPYRVGKMSGVDASIIQRFLAGERSPSLETADKICRALDLVLVPRPGSNLALDLLREREKQGA